VRIKKPLSHLADPAAVAANLERIADAAPAAPDFDPRRVEAVKDALARGVYEIDAGRIADTLIQLDPALRLAGRFPRR